MNENVVGRPMEILLVEDSLVQARLTIGALKNGNVKHRLTFMRDGAEALEFLRRNGRFSQAPIPDLILLDLRLPKVDGLEVLAEIKRDSQLQGIPVVVMTSSDDDEDRSQCEQFHVAAYINKPVNLEKFLLLVRKLKQYWRDDVILPAIA